MNFEQQLIFLLSALGGTNGAILSGYFLFKRKDKRLSDYFLGGLLLMLSVRTIKSAFIFFNRDLFEVFIQFGLVACLLIGPFLYIYTLSMVKTAHKLKARWWWHILPNLLVIMVVSYFYPYYEYRPLWQQWFIELIYKQWGMYVFLSAFQIRFVFQKIWSRNKLEDHESWLLNVFLGTFIVWLAYETSYYTSYIVGALSFTFILYTSLLLWLFKRLKKDIAKDPPLKYANSMLSASDVHQIKSSLDTLMQREKLYTDPDLNLKKLSDHLGINSKDLSQVINQTAGQNYSQYIAHLRVEEAKRLLTSPEFDHFKIAAIAHESGFNSLSSFNNYFKKIVGTTARAFKNAHIKG